MKQDHSGITVRITLYYFVLANLYIYASDQLLFMYVTDPAILVRWQTYKGWIYIAVTTLLLYILLKNQIKKLLSEVEERKKAEAAERASANYWQKTFDASADAICLVDRSKKILRANAALANLTGQDAEEIIGKNCCDTVHREKGEFPDCPLPDTGNLQSREETEVQIEDRWYHISIDPVLDEKGRLQNMVHIMRDITQRKNMESNLQQAYEDTIEGWSRALDLRDHDTEGHSKRVTEETVYLATVYGVPEPELVHIRRGALLHDIGKVGIPDSILLKTGKLTNEEWTVMQEHPKFAYELLAPIDYLQPALEIPYCHHEKWDGSGYPRGLKGEEIPLAARIFAVIDVFDALTSDRPYRPAWNREAALEHILNESGRHFDPQIVKLFLELVDPGRDGT